MKKSIVIFVVFLIAFFTVFKLLQSDNIYKKTLGNYSKNWLFVNDSVRVLSTDPFTKLTNENYVQWDGEHYLLIKNYGYNSQKAGSDFIFAFFPMFPVIWHLSHLPPLGILFINYTFLLISILIIQKKIFKSENEWVNVLLSLSLPSIIIFFIPYSEATYLLFVIIGISGLLNKKYWIYFLAFFLAALTRPSYTFLFIAIICTELFFLIENKNILNSFKRVISLTAPLILGTLTVSIIQLGFNSGSFFKFIEVQKYWGNEFSIPHNLRDWSEEGFGINIGVIFLISLPIIGILFRLTIQQFLNFSKISEAKKEGAEYDLRYIRILSMIYLSGAFLFILFFHGGSLHCLFRFVMCTPFFYLLFFSAHKELVGIPNDYKIFIFITLSTICLFVLGLTNFSTYWNFHDFGLMILTGTLLLWFFQGYKKNKIFLIALYLNLFFSIIWTSYLFNSYLSNCWIFA